MGLGQFRSVVWRILAIEIFFVSALDIVFR